MIGRSWKRLIAAGIAAGGASGEAAAQEAPVWEAGELIPGLLAFYTHSADDLAAVAAFYSSMGPHVVGIGRFSHLVVLQCEPGEEWAWLAIARADERISSAQQDRGGYPGFTVPPSEMPQPLVEPPSWQYHDLWFLQNTGQDITENSGNEMQTGDLGADIHMLSAWTITQGDPDIVVAIFDSGIDFDHPEFNGRLDTPGLALTCPAGIGSINCCTGSPLVCTYGSAIDNDGHGTAVASVAGANVDNGHPGTFDEEQYAGVDPGCTFFPVRISFDNIPAPSLVLLALNMIYFAEDTELRPEGVPLVINMSFTFGEDNPLDATLVGLHNALDQLKAWDVVVVSISGNGGDGQADTDAPAVWDNTFTVAGTDMHDERMDVGVVVSGTGEHVDFAAPGFGIYFAVCPLGRGCKAFYADNYLSGTSASAPCVTGIVSLILARAKALSVTPDWDDIYDLIKNGAVDVGDPGFDEVFGWGRVDAYAALNGL